VCVSSRRRHTRSKRDWSSDVCSSDLSSGPGGQSVNTTMSAVRLTHEPTGIVVSIQDEKSQIKNREKAMKVLRARIYDLYQQEAQAEYDESRKSAIGTGDR